MTIINDNYIYYDRSAEKEWNKIKFKDGRILQSAELNEIQTIFEIYQTRLGRTIFKDGDIISGCQISVPINNKITMTSGKVFVDGRIRTITGRGSDDPIAIKGSGEEIIGLKRIVVYQNESWDNDLREQAEGFGVKGSAGAHREIYEYEWVVDDSSAIQVYVLLDGYQKVIIRPTFYSQLYDTLARRTYDESGHYALRKFVMRSIEDATDSSKWTLVVEPSKAYVKGYEVETGVAQKISMNKARSYETIFAEFSVRSEYVNLYELTFDNVRTIESLSAPVFKEVSIIRGGISGGKDEVPNTPLFKLIAVNQGGTWDSNNEQYVGGTDFTEGVDYFQEGNNISWELGADEPDPGSTYRIAFLYTATLDKGERIKTNVDVESVTRDTTSNIDWLTFEDGVQDSLIFTDQFGNEIPQQYKEGVDYIFITGNNPEDNLRANKNYSMQIGKCGIYWNPSANNSPLLGSTYYVKYSYWKHTVEGDYIGADSYDNYEEITVNETSDLYYRDYVDFRPTESMEKTRIAYYNEQFSIRYTYYLSRIDLVYIDENADIKVIEGSPATSPVKPNELEETLTIGWVTLPPYTYNLSDIIFEYKKNIRYRMEDIRKLEKRIEKLEYFSTLDLLQQDALGKYTSKLKKGIYVDSFHGSKNADIYFNDGNVVCNCAFDQNRQSIKLKAVIDQERLFTNPSSTTAKLNHFLYTLPFEETIHAEQLFATDSMTVQPFEVFTQAGELYFDPEVVNFVDSTRGADFVTNFDNQNDHFTQDLGTIWNSWQDINVGREVITSTGPTNWELSRPAGVRGIEHGAWVSRNLPMQSVNGRRVEELWESSGRQTQRGFVPVTRERTGVALSTVPENMTLRSGERVVNASIAAFVPSQPVTITGKLLRPNQDNLEVYFDEKIIEVYNQNPSSAYTGRVATNERGEFTCTFNIPEGTRVGSREIRITNENTAPETEKTIASGILECYGISQTKAEPWTTLTVPQIRTQEVSARETTRRFFERDVRVREFRDVPVGVVDPIAQSFISDPLETIYISAIDLYFKRKPDENISKDPVILFLRGMDKGYPTEKIIAKAIVDIEDINVSDDASIPTKFVFDDPVMIDPATEICMVAFSISPDYEIFYSELGERDIQSDLIVSKNPYSGVLFTSANSSTWQADGFKDLKFRIYKCNFENDCELVFRNISGKEAGIILLKSSQIIPDDCYIDWYYSIDNGTTYNPIDPLRNKTLSELLTNVTLKASITGSGLSPMIHRDALGITFVKHELSGNYVSKIINLNEYSNDIKIILDQNMPGSTSIKIYFQIEEDDVWRGYNGISDWDNITTVGIDQTWTEYTYSIENLDNFRKLRIRIEMESENKIISPECRRLRIICT